MRIQPKFNPFPGLRAFLTEEDYLFFGREDQVNELLSRLRQYRFLSVLGASGSGKSSLVRAGMLPALQGGAMTSAGSHWEIAIMRPGGNPILNLAKALFEMDLYDFDESEAVFHLQATLKRSGLGLSEAVKQSELKEGANILIVVDQFEELFRFSRSGQLQDEGAAAFVKLLLEASRQTDIPIYVAITMRSDYIGDCAQFPDLTESVNEGEYLVPRLKRDQRRAAIEGPIKVAGSEIKPRLTQKLLNDFGNDPDQLPILQHALMRMWDKWLENRGADDPLDLEHYKAIGGMAGALSQHADEVFADADTEEERRDTRRVFQAITEKGGDNRGIRRPTQLVELCQITGADHETVIRIIDRFRKPGCTFLMPPHEVTLTNDTVIDISHESLMRVWVSLKRWVDDESQSARIYVRLAETAQLHSCDRAGLYRDPDLQIALSWREETQPTKAWGVRYHSEYDQSIRFLDESNKVKKRLKREKEAAYQRELEQAKRLAAAEKQRAEEQANSVSKLRKWMAAVGFTAILALIATIFAHSASQEAQENAEQAQNALKQAEESERETEIEKQRFEEQLYNSQILAAEVALSRENHQRAEDILWQASERYRNWEWGYLMNQATIDILTLEGHAGALNSACFSPDESLVLTASLDKTARVWSLSGGNEQTRLVGHNGSVTSARFSPDGKRVVTSSLDRTARVWQLPEGKLLFQLQGHTDTVQSASFSPDGRYIVTASQDGNAHLWNSNTGQLLRKLSGHSGGIQSAEFSTNSQQILTASDDRTILLWDIEKEDSPKLFSGHNSGVTHARFALEGNRIMSITQNQTMNLWKLNGEILSSFQHASATGSYWRSITSLSAKFDFEPKGNNVALVSPADKTVKIVNLADVEKNEASLGFRTQLLKGHKQGVTDICYSADGRFIVTASQDKTAKIWRLAPKGQSIPLNRPNVSHLDAQFSPNGELLLTTLNTGVVEERDQGNMKLVSSLNGHEGNVFMVQHNPNGDRFLSASSDGVINVWDTGNKDDKVTIKIKDRNKVWTKQAPLNWEIDDSGVPGAGDLNNDGVTEWAGWSFTEKNWWIQVSADQQRSRFTKGSGIIAVADSDEWDDKPHKTGNYNTFLRTSEIQVDGIKQRNLVLNFDSAWQPEGLQSANIELVYDGGKRIEVMRWDSAQGSAGYKGLSPNEAVAIPINVPESANTMQLVFGYFNAMNNWYWAIDNITLSSAEGIIYRENFDGLNLRHSIDEGSEFDVSFSPDGRKILTTQNDAQIFDANTGMNLHRFYQWPGIAYSKFNHDGSYLYTVTKDFQGFGRKVALWNMKDFKKEKEFRLSNAGWGSTFDINNTGGRMIGVFRSPRIWNLDMFSTKSVSDTHLEWQNEIIKKDLIVLGVWNRIGPFHSDSYEEAYSHSYISETEIKTESAVKKLKHGLTASPELQDGLVHLIKGVNKVNYLFRTIQVKRSRPIFLSLGSGGGIKLWHNGKLVLKNEIKRMTSPNQENIRLELTPGKNLILMKIVNSQEEGGFVFSVNHNFDDAPILSNMDWKNGINPGYTLAYWEGVGLRWNISDGIQQRSYIPSNAPIDNGNWHHIVVTHDRSGNGVGYQNGSEIFNITISGVGNLDTPKEMITAVGTDGLIGRNWPGWFNGLIDELAVWKRVLSPEEVAQLSQKKQPIKFSEDLILHQKFDGDVLDSSGKEINGKSYGHPSYVDGVMGKAISLDASRRQYISLGRPKSLNFGESDNFSISLWVRAKEYSPATITENISKILKTPNSQRNQSENKALKLYYTSTQSLNTPTILKGHEKGVWGAVFSPDGNQVITASQDETARIWNAETGQTEHILRPETGPVREVFFSTDSSRVITASGEESMTLWNPATGSLMHKFDNLGSRVIKVIFNPDGHKLVAITEDGDLHLWEAAPWRLDDLPGDSSLSWEERYNLWNKKWLTHKWQTN